MEATDQLHDNVSVGAENRTDIFGPNHITRHPRLLLSLDVPIADVGQAKQTIAAFTQNFGDSAANGSKAYQGDAGRGGAVP